MAKEKLEYSDLDFKIGDVLQVSNDDGLYEFYDKAFKYFGVHQFAKKYSDNGYKLSLPFDYQKYHWIVKNVAYHENNQNVLLLLACAESRCYVVYDYVDGIWNDSIKLYPNFDQSKTDFIRNKHINHVIEKIF